MKLKLLYTATAILTGNFATAQVLFSENFDNLTVGALSTDPTGATPGQNGWYVMEHTNETEVAVVAEPGKGNVAHIKPNATANTGDWVRGNFAQKDISAMWNNRNAGNDILHLEMEYYFAANNSSAIASTIAFMGRDGTDDNTSFFSILQIQDILYTFYRQTDGSGGVGKFYHNSVVINTWVSLEVFVDYNTGNMYLYIPSLSIIEGFPFSHSSSPYIFSIGHSQEVFSNLNIGGKYDNIRISALKTLPAYLGINDFVSSKFNVFPNPVKDLITITNNENISIEQIDLFDMSGKTIKSQKFFNKENKIQLNIGDFASGTYLLHIHTNAGRAVKKIIKE